MTQAPLIHVARPEVARIHGLVQRLRKQYTGDPAAIRIVKAPLRISPLGAHIDHQLGQVSTILCKVSGRSFPGFSHFLDLISIR